MSGENPAIELTLDELREVTAFAIACAEPALAIFERDRRDDPRPRAVLDAARAFATGGPRTKAIRDTAFAAHRAAKAAHESGLEAAAAAARAAAHAGGAAYLHPLAKATQVPHILGSAAYAAHAFELDSGDSGGDSGGGDQKIGADYLEKAANSASPTVVRVLMRYPHAPDGSGRVGELWRRLDALLRLPKTDAPHAFE